MNYKFVKDYKDNELLRESFNRLAIKTFQLDFSPWYDKGYWTKDYIPYSFMYEDEIIANVSVNKMDLLIDNKNYKALQIGTVMTDERYRNRGLSKKLLNYVLETYKDQVDFIYLFSNKDALAFYPKFGFKIYCESEYILDVSQYEKYEKLNKAKKIEDVDLSALKALIKDKKPLSTRLDCINNNLLMFYLTIAFRENIYYLEEENSFILMEKDPTSIHLYDIISRESYNMDNLIKSIISEETQDVQFYFSADTIENIQVNKFQDMDDSLFIYGDNPLKGHFRFPITSHS